MNWRSVAGPLGLAGMVMVAGGCASYESRPLDLDAHRERFTARSPADDSVRRFILAHRLPGMTAGDHR